MIWASICLCLVCNRQILLGMRNNEPLEGCWFSPGGRIYKNESWQKALLRIIKGELGLLDKGPYRPLLRPHRIAP